MVHNGKSIEKWMMTGGTLTSGKPPIGLVVDAPPTGDELTRPGEVAHRLVDAESQLGGCDYIH